MFPAPALLNAALPIDPDIKAISKFAQLEFKFGSSERGRTIFESLLANYPQRTDLWSMFIDTEMAHLGSRGNGSGGLSPIRALFDRVISLKLSAKKVQSFFKKYLAFEKEHGSPETVEVVRQKAREYIEAHAV